MADPVVAAAEAALRALAAKEKCRSPEQQARYDEVQRRAAAIQKYGVRPVDGVTFGKGRQERKRS